MFKKVGVHLYINHCEYPLSPTATSSAMNSPQNIQENPDDPEPINEGEIQMRLLCLVAQPNYRSSNRKLPVRT